MVLSVLSYDAITSFAPSLHLFLYLIMARPQFLLPSWRLDLINSLPSPALKVLDGEAMTYASSRVRFYPLNDCFFCSSNVVDPTSVVSDMSQQNARNPAVSLPKVDRA